MKNPEQKQQKQHWKVAVNNVPLRKLFTYRCPENLHLKPGDLVKVPFGLGNKKLTGLIVEESFMEESFGEATLGSSTPSDQLSLLKETEHLTERQMTDKQVSERQIIKIKDILEKDSEKPSLSQAKLKWLKWVSDYYLYPLGRVYPLAYPPLKRTSSRKTRKSPIVPETSLKEKPILTQDQKQAFEKIQLEHFKVHLLWGVTGSGKTEVYMESIEKVLALQKSVMILVPEISITPQLIRRFSERFYGKIAVIHSQLTPREKTNQWWQVVGGEKSLLVGARSALFCPMPKLGLIIIDEEHEGSFKQEEKLKYNARDSAIKMAQLEDCPVLLGSATPSLESWQNAINGRYQLISMKKRVLNRPLPTVEIISPKKDRDRQLPYWLSSTLYKKLKKNYEDQLQSALFINRRGMAPFVQCYSCGFTYLCPNCDISLTLHGKKHLVCHYCDYHHLLDEDCPDCKEGELKSIGLGTEAVEKSLGKLFPRARIFRADRDEIDNRLAMEEMIKKMEKHEIDFLVGTQIIAKGLDFQNLTLVGILHADGAFNIPDFRANERGFQLCTQVSGRAGRHQKEGHVVIQSYKTDHSGLLSAQSQNYLSFSKMELENRKLFNYPPFGKLAVIRILSPNKKKLVKSAELLASHLVKMVKMFPELNGAGILGPTPAPLTRIKNQYRYHILIKAKNHQIIHHIADTADRYIHQSIKDIKYIIDIDPYQIL